MVQYSGSTTPFLVAIFSHPAIYKYLYLSKQTKSLPKTITAFNNLKEIKLKNKIYTFTALLALLFSCTATAGQFILPDTGQDTCYGWTGIIECPQENEDFYGQDANYTINPPQLIDNSNSTITDLLTGLTWEKKGRDNETLSYSYTQAVDYCQDLSLGNQSEWRMPTRKEFSTIMNFGRVSPALDKDFFPYYTTGTEPEMYYWTSSEYCGDNNKVWKILLAFGLINKGAKSGGPSKVMCVTGSMESSNMYRANKNGTITDLVTGLMWEKKTGDNGSRDKNNTYTWKDALNYCENLSLGNYSDWRIPNPKELERIVNLQQNNPAADTLIFPGTSSGLYWTGTSCSGCHKMKAFAIDFSDGTLYYGNKYRRKAYGKHFVRAVRTEFTPAQVNCPAGLACNNDSSTLNTVRLYRNKILQINPHAKKYIGMYYKHGAEVSEILRSDKDALILAEKVLKKLIPDMKSALNGKGMKISLKPSDDIMVLINRIESASGKSLSRDLKQLKTDLKKKEFLENLKITVE